MQGESEIAYTPSEACLPFRVDSEDGWSEELLTMKVVQLNRFVKQHGFSADDVRDLKMTRRKVKNRAYARDSRRRRKTEGGSKPRRSGKSAKKTGSHHSQHEADFSDSDECPTPTTLGQAVTPTDSTSAAGLHPHATSLAAPLHAPLGALAVLASSATPASTTASFHPSLYLSPQLSHGGMMGTTHGGMMGATHGGMVGAAPFMAYQSQMFLPSSSAAAMAASNAAAAAAGRPTATSEHARFSFDAMVGKVPTPTDRKPTLLGHFGGASGASGVGGSAGSLPAMMLAGGMLAGGMARSSSAPTLVPSTIPARRDALPSDEEIDQLRQRNRALLDILNRPSLRPFTSPALATMHETFALPGLPLPPAAEDDVSSFSGSEHWTEHDDHSTPIAPPQRRSAWAAV